MIYSASWKSVTESVTKTVRYAGALRCVTVRYGDALGALCWYVTVRYAGALRWYG